MVVSERMLMLMQIDSQIDSKIKSLTWILKPLTLVISYGIWTLLARLLMLTLITYFMISPTIRFQDISEVFSSNEVTLMGIGAALFVGLMYWLNPITSVERQEIVSSSRLEKEFLPGILHGLFVASVFIFLFALAGLYQNLGNLIEIQDAPFKLANIIVCTIALAIFVYFEEFIFRYQLVKYFRAKMSSILSNSNLSKLSGPITVLVIGIPYCLVKMLQFKLSLLQLLTLFLASGALTYRAICGESFSKGAGIWAGILITFHPLLSLPIFGNSFSGVLLMKPFEGLRFLTGGAGGPLSSIGFQLLLAADLLRSVLKQRNLVTVKAQ